MFRKLSYGLVALGALAVGAVAQGATTTLLYLPAAGSNVVGSNDAAPGFPSGSWQSSAPGSKSEVYIAASSLFSQPVTIGDIASISYWTNVPGATGQDTGGQPNWTFYIYTPKTGSGDTGSFYHTRLNSEPYFSNASALANTWHQWTSGGANAMKFYDVARDGGLFGTYTDPTLAQIQSGPVTWPTSGTSVDYRSEAVNLFSFQTGSGWGSSFNGLLDGFVVTLNNGDVGIVNFEAAAPLPSPVWGGLALLVMAGAVKKYRQVKAVA